MANETPSQTATLDVIERSKDDVGKAGAAFYFDPATLATGKEHGLDGFRWYMLGRGGVLGDVEAPVIAAAFGYFHIDLVTKIWNSARETMDARAAGSAYFECCAAIGRARLADVPGLDAYNEAAELVIEAADPAALSLFAGIAAEPKTNDPAGRAMQNTAVLRELRGSAHLVAVVASGLTAPQANVIKRPDDIQMFGFDSIDAPEDGATRHATAEALTSQLLLDAYAVLDEAQGNAIVQTSAAIAASLAAPVAD